MREIIVVNKEDYFKGSNLGNEQLKIIAKIIEANIILIKKKNNNNGDEIGRERIEMNSDDDLYLIVRNDHMNGVYHRNNKEMRKRLINALDGYRKPRDDIIIETMSPKKGRAKTEWKSKATELNKNKIGIVSKDVVYHFKPEVLIHEGKKNNGFDKCISRYNALVERNEKGIDITTLIGDKELIKFSTIVNDLKTIRRFDITKMENVIVDVDTPLTSFISFYDFTEEIARHIGYCIDIECSGKDVYNNMIWRLFNSLSELKEHWRTSHENISPKNRVILMCKPSNEFRILGVKNGGVFYFFFVKEEMYLNRYDTFDPEEYVKNKTEIKKPIKLDVIKEEKKVTRDYNNTKQTRIFIKENIKENKTNKKAIGLDTSLGNIINMSDIEFRKICYDYFNTNNIRTIDIVDYLKLKRENKQEIRME
jgi:hypothetical protein